jgi:filamentous hemagglutinin
VLRNEPVSAAGGSDEIPAASPQVDSNRSQSPQATAPSRRAQKKENARGQKDASDNSLVVRDVVVRDEDHRVVFRGDVDLAPTLKRIESGKRLRFSHDGVVFENRERRLPAMPSGYYHEFVQPTPGDDGPGAQRVILGAEGEVFYSYDHYRTFRRIR